MCTYIFYLSNILATYSSVAIRKQIDALKNAWNISNLPTYKLKGIRSAFEIITKYANFFIVIILSLIVFL